MSDRIEAEILDVLGEEVAAAVDTPLVVIEGPKGDPGAPGKDGHSPVVTATKSGKTTTISVDGAAIATVEDGADGSPVNWRGAWEEDTEYSKLDAVSYDGSSYIFTSDTHVIGSIPGVDEEWGLMAQKGNDGANGVTPHIGDNGHWYLGATDTGKPSRGETGAQGTPGIYYGTTQPTGDTHPVWIDPDGDPDDGGLLPAVTAADNGKVLRVDNGAWAPVDMPTGGGGEKWELIKAITIADDAAESNALTINMDESGNPFSLKKAKIFGIFPAYTGESTIPNFSFFMLNGVTTGINCAYCYTSGWEIPGTNIIKSCSIEVDLTAPGLQNETVHRSHLSSKEFFGPAKIESVTSIGGTNMLIYPGCRFWLYGVRKEGTA